MIAERNLLWNKMKRAMDRPKVKTDMILKSFNIMEETEPKAPSVAGEEEDIETTLDLHLSQKPRVPIIREFGPRNRILSKKAPRQPYEEIIEPQTALHWGQRKLIISEIEFLTLYGSNGDTSSPPLVVYAGAAGGHHIPYLSSMFPHLDFHLYDPAPFAIKASDKIKIFNEKMTDKVAASYASLSPATRVPVAGRDVLFISDIRTVANPSTIRDPKARAKAKEQYSMRIAEDNAMQLSWTQKMNPVSSMVKFKLPYEDVETGTSKDGYTMYPRGHVHLPVWGKQSTTETRLIFEDPHDLRKYRHKKYEEQMAYFNNNTLLSYYLHEYTKDYQPLGMDHCYSCKSELFLLEQYVDKVYGTVTQLVKESLVKRLSENISRAITDDGTTLQSKWDKQMGSTGYEEPED